MTPLHRLARRFAADSDGRFDPDEVHLAPGRALLLYTPFPDDLDPDGRLHAAAALSLLSDAARLAARSLDPARDAHPTSVLADLPARRPGPLVVATAASAPHARGVTVWATLDAEGGPRLGRLRARFVPAAWPAPLATGAPSLN